MRRFLIPATAATVLFLSAPFILAQKAESAGDEKEAVGKLGQEYQAAFNKGDAKALTAFWAEDGEVIDLRGERTQGRALLEHRYKQFFAQHPGVKLDVEVLSVRRVSPDTAILDVVPEITPPLQGQPAVRGTVILVKRDDHWLIDSARETLRGALSGYEHLKELEWMVGSWRGAAGLPAGIAFHSNCDWTMSKTYLVRSFTVEHKDKDTPVVNGTQVIAWDPHERRIRSWVFDSTGSFSQGLWRREGKQWTIDVSGVLADGSKVTATDVVTLVDPSTFTYQSKNRTSDGQRMPEIPVIQFQRERAALPAAKPAQKILP